MPGTRTIVHNAAVLTADQHNTAHDPGTIVIDDGRITDVGPSEPTDPNQPATTVIDGRGMLAMPGLVNAHTHLELTGLHGSWGDLGPGRLVAAILATFQQRSAYSRLARAGAPLAMANMLSSGITTFNSLDRDPQPLARAASDSGIRAQLAPMLSDVLLPETITEQTARAHHFITENHDTANGRIRTALGVDGDVGSGRGTWRRAAELRAQHPEQRLHTHVLETRLSDPTHRLIPRHSTLGVPDQLGLIDDRAMLAHFVHARPADVRRAAATGASVLHCPGALSHFGTGATDWPPLTRLHQHGVATGLGLDDPYWINSWDLFREANHARRMANFRFGAPAVDSPRLLRMLTIDGARAIGLDDRVGSLEPGKRADVVLADLDHPRFEPRVNLPALAVDSLTADRVHTVLVDGDVVVSNGRVRTIDVERARTELRQAADEFAAATGWTRTPRASSPPAKSRTLWDCLPALSRLTRRFGNAARNRVTERVPTRRRHTPHDGEPR